MIIIDGITKSFGNIKAVDSLSLEIPRGQCLGLLGPNGAGKTTTIRTLVGGIHPDSGDVTLDGEPTFQRSARAKMGIAPQALAIYEELTAVENLQFFAALYGLSRQESRERVEWALQFAQLESRRNDRVSSYSGGMKRRLNLAAALVHDPPVLFLDEPTVGVDPQSRNHIFESIKQLHQQGRTIVYTTHYMEEVQRLCDRVAILDHGQLLAVDTVEGLISQHADSSVVTAELDRQGSSEASTHRLPGEVTDNFWIFHSRDPFREIGEAMTAGVRLQSLQVAAPNLENVFLNLTGRSLRD